MREACLAHVPAGDGKDPVKDWSRDLELLLLRDVLQPRQHGLRGRASQATPEETWAVVVIRSE